MAETGPTGIPLHLIGSITSCLSKLDLLSRHSLRCGTPEPECLRNLRKLLRHVMSQTSPGKHACTGEIGPTGILLHLIGSEYDVATALRWLRGSLNDVQMSDVPITLTVTVLGSTLLLICNRYLRLMQLGDAYAIPMGIPVGKVRLCIMLCALLLSATATSVTGPIASVAFLSGPIAVKCTGNGRPLCDPPQRGITMLRRFSLLCRVEDDTDNKNSD